MCGCIRLHSVPHHRPLYSVIYRSTLLQYSIENKKALPDYIPFLTPGNNLQSFDDGEWIPRLRNRVSTLGKELYGKGADYTVPLDLIVQALEGLRQAYNEIHKENQLSNPWPIETILSIGFSFDALYRSYDSLYLEADGDINWLASLLELLKIWVNDAFNYDSLPAGSVGSSASSQLAQAVKNGGLIDRIRTYIAALDGMDGAIIDELKIGFSEVEDAIRKGF